MRTLKLTVEYDGTDFHGFQRQPELRTVQGVLEGRFSRLLGEEVRVVGAGRTDAGVHALGQVVSLRTSRPLPVQRAAEVMNTALPADVKVQRCEEAAPDFHARRWARSRKYRYTVVEREAPSPILGRFALVAPPGLSVERMAAAARALRGRRDFRALQAAGSPARTTERTLLELDCQREGERICITAEADSFLYRMARLLAGALLAVGRGELAPEALVEAVARGEREGVPGPAPACGLCLVAVSYGEGGPR